MPDATTDFKAGLIIAVPSRGNTRIEWAQNLKMLEMPVGYSWMVHLLLQPECDEARNVAVMTARQREAEYLLFIDDDTLLPNQAVRRMVYLMEQHTDWDLLSGVYVAKTDPPQPMVFNDKLRPDWDWKFNTQFPISGCGMGCAMIRMSALEDIPEPWFKFVRRSQGIDHFEEGEDLYFCRKLREAGKTLMADGGLLCGHIDSEGRIFSVPFDSRPIQQCTPEELKNTVIMDATHTHNESVAA